MYKDTSSAMIFRFYNQAMSQASRTMAMGIFMLGLMLVGLGVLIAAFPKVFAYVMAGVFMAAGLGCVSIALRIILSQRRLSKAVADSTDLRSPNVRVRPPDS